MGCGHAGRGGIQEGAHAGGGVHNSTILVYSAILLTGAQEWSARGAGWEWGGGWGMRERVGEGSAGGGELEELGGVLACPGHAGARIRRFYDSTILLLCASASMSHSATRLIRAYIRSVSRPVISACSSRRARERVVAVAVVATVAVAVVAVIAVAVAVAVVVVVVVVVAVVVVGRRLGGWTSNVDQQ